jgi:pimeloyl-ACP methyl ester carboxylesterase
MPAMTCRRTLFALMTVVLPLIAGACAAPVGAVRVDPKSVQRELTGNVLTTGELSRSTRNALVLHGLSERFDDEPEAALDTIRTNILAGRTGPHVFPAAAELSFFHAERTGKRSYYLAAAVYAWIFLFPDGGASPPDPLDPRLRMAADLYNRGITLGLASPDGSVMEMRAGTYELPWGELQVAFDRERLHWAGRELISFVPVAELRVEGLEVRFRRPGIGAALAAGIAPIPEEQQVRDIIAPRVKVAATALLRIEDARSQLETGRMQAALELYPESETETTVIAGRTVPLEEEPSAALAWGLQEAPLWDRELRGFLGTVFQVGATNQLVSLTPHRFGQIPVVFVHGTASSAGRWAEMINVLQADPAVRDRYDFWTFSYDTGSPIVYSSMILRDALTSAVHLLDPEGKDPGLKRMVVIGHSQGGLLTKMTVVHTGSTLYDAAFTKPLDQLQLSADTRDLVRRAMFVEPLPFVKQVVFICTPHRGSYLAARDFVTSLLRRIVSTPARLVKGTAELLANREAFAVTQGGNRLPTAVDNMSPRNPFIKALSIIPVDPGVDAHSIIAVKGDGPIETGDDGVVTYESAHIGGVKSELVVRWDHSVQGQPEAILEVRRILLQNAGAQ